LEELEEVDPADLDAMRQALRDQLREVLLSGDAEAIRRLARQAVSSLGRAETQPGRQSWFTYRVLRAMSPETLMASLLEAVLAGQDRGGLAEKVARQMLTERIREFEEAVEAEVRRRLAEERGVAAFAHFTVLLAFALREQFAKVRVFAFVDTCDEVTSFFDAGGDVVDALARMSKEADVVWFDGHSDYGHSFEVFTQRWPEAVTP